MQAEDLVLDEGGKGEEVEKIGEGFPHIGIAVFSETLVVEAVDLGDLAGLVISSKDGDALGVTDLKANKEGDCFYRVIPAVDVVACDISGDQLHEPPTYP